MMYAHKPIVSHCENVNINFRQIINSSVKRSRSPNLKRRPQLLCSFDRVSIQVFTAKILYLNFDSNFSCMHLTTGYRGPSMIHSLQRMHLSKKHFPTCKKLRPTPHFIALANSYKMRGHTQFFAGGKVVKKKHQS